MEGTTKTGRKRSVALGRTVALALAHHLDTFRPHPEGYIFTGPDGGLVGRTNFRARVWRPALGAAGIAPSLPRVYDLRYSAISGAIAQGAHPKQIQELAGHEDIQTTFNTYGHLFPSLTEALAETLDRAYEAAPDDGHAVEKLGPVTRAFSLWKWREDV